MIITFFGKGGSGKTTMAIHLAKVFASKGKSVLLLSVETRYGALQRNIGIKVPDEKSLVNALLDASNESYYQSYLSNVFILSLSDTDTVSKSDIVSNVLRNSEVVPRFIADINQNFDVVVVDSTERLTDELTYHFVLNADKVIHTVDSRPEGLAYYNAHKDVQILREREIILLNKLDESIANKSTIEAVIEHKINHAIPFMIKLLRSSYKVETDNKLIKKLEPLYHELTGTTPTKKGLFGKKKGA